MRDWEEDRISVLVAEWGRLESRCRCLPAGSPMQVAVAEAMQAVRDELAVLVDAGRPDLDPRWEWTEITTVTDRERQWVKGRCRHLVSERCLVTSIVTGEVLAGLCMTCDEQLPAR